MHEGQSYAYCEPHQPSKSADGSGLSVPFATSIRAGEAFTTEPELERMTEEFRPVRGRRSMLNPSLDRSDERTDNHGDPEGPDLGEAGLVFAAHNNHDPRCGWPPRLRNTDDPGFYYGYFENCYGEQFVFTFDRATRAGTVWGGDLGWDNRKSFTLDLLDEALRARKGSPRRSRSPGCRGVGLPVIDAAAGAGPPHRPDGEGRGDLAEGVPGRLHSGRGTA